MTACVVMVIYVVMMIICVCGVFSVVIYICGLNLVACTSLARQFWPKRTVVDINNSCDDDLCLRCLCCDIYVGLIWLHACY